MPAKNTSDVFINPIIFALKYPVIYPPGSKKRCKNNQKKKVGYLITKTIEIVKNKNAARII